jgi:hypothetical protein
VDAGLRRHDERAPAEVSILSTPATFRYRT